MLVIKNGRPWGRCWFAYSCIFIAPSESLGWSLHQFRRRVLLKSACRTLGCGVKCEVLCFCRWCVVPAVSRVFKIQWKIATSRSFDRGMTETPAHVSVINSVPHLDPTNAGAFFLRDTQSNQNGGVWSVKCHGGVFLSAGVDGITTVQVMPTTQLSIFLFSPQLSAQHPFYMLHTLINI